MSSINNLNDYVTEKVIKYISSEQKDIDCLIGQYKSLKYKTDKCVNSNNKNFSECVKYSISLESGQIQRGCKCYSCATIYCEYCFKYCINENGVCAK